MSSDFKIWWRSKKITTLSRAAQNRPYFLGGENEKELFTRILVASIIIG